MENGHLQQSEFALIHAAIKLILQELYDGLLRMHLTVPGLNAEESSLRFKFSCWF